MYIAVLATNSTQTTTWHMIFKYVWSGFTNKLKWLSFLYLFPPIYICHPSFVLCDDFIQAFTDVFLASVHRNMAIMYRSMNEMAVILQTKIAGFFFLEWEFSLHKISYFLFKFHTSLILRIPLATHQCWFMWWLGIYKCGKALPLSMLSKCFGARWRYRPIMS